MIVKPLVNVLINGGVMKKLNLILCGFLILFTGCSVKHDITITDKKKVEEKTTITVSNSYINEQNYSVDEFLDHYKYIYGNAENFKDYKIKTKKSKPNSYFIVTRNYNTVEEYVNSNSFKSMFVSADIENTGKYFTFISSRNDYLYNLKNDMLISEENKYDSVEINIKFYNEVIDSNADKVDKHNNIYTWYVDESKSADDSYIYFKLGPKVKYFVKIKDIIMKNIVAILVVVGLLLAIAMTTLYIVYKSKKNNEI